MLVHNLVGVDYGEGPPVPISNTVVKLTGAENTWLATARENRLTPTQTERLAQASLFCFFLPPGIDACGETTVRAGGGLTGGAHCDII